MSKLHRFWITKVHSSYGNMAANLAVLGSIYGRLAHKEKVRSLHGRLRRHYRAWLQDLYNQDAAFIRSPAELTVMKNCPPWGVVTEEHTTSAGSKLRPCQRHLFCPYCFARRMVFPVYNAMMRSLFGNEEKTDNVLNELRVVTTYNTGGEVAMADIVSKLRNQDYRRQLFDNSDAAGGVAVFTVDLHPKRGVRLSHSALGVSRKGVSLTEAGKSDETKGQVRTRMVGRYFSAPDRATLALAVARSARYPRYTIGTANAGWVDLAYQALRGVHMLSTFGTARRGTSKEE